MGMNLILAGVGGQGVLSLAYGLCFAARERGWNFKQAEVHGMAQRGGAVVSHLRISPGAIHSDMIPRGSADMVLAIEPLECLRYAHFLTPGGVLISSTSPVANVSDYPDLEALLDRISGFEKHVLVDANYLGTVAGSVRAANMVMLGAGGTRLGFSIDQLTEPIRSLFQVKGPRAVEANCRALRLGALAGRFYGEGVAAGRSRASVLKALADFPPQELIAKAEALDGSRADAAPMGMSTKG